MSGGCQEGVKRLSRWCQEGVKGVVCVRVPRCACDKVCVSSSVHDTVCVWQCVHHDKVCLRRYACAVH